MADLTQKAARDLTDQIRTGMESIYHLILPLTRDGRGPLLGMALGTSTSRESSGVCTCVRLWRTGTTSSCLYVRSG